MINKKLSFAIIGGERGEHIEDLISEIENAGYLASHINIKELTLISGEKGFDVLYQDKSILDFDIFILRNAFRSLKNEMCIVANFLLENKKTIADQVIGENYVAGKIYESYLLSKKKIATPLTIQVLSDENKNKIVKKLKFPIIVKPIVGSKGRGVQKIDNQNDLNKLNIFEGSDKFFFQEYIPISYDIRVFVVGKEVLGAMKRYVKDDDFRSNASLGSRVEKIDVTENLKKIALEAVAAYGYEVAGVDIVIHNNKEYILEVNNAPQWLAFKRVVGVNPAKFIVRYMINKYKNKENE